LAVALGFACLAAIAPPRPSYADDTNLANVAAARKHFDKARAFYGQGAYRDAITELEAAHALDPNAKDLVFNLGVVHEKLADIEDALKWFRLYTTMDLTAQERERADAYIKRLEGAKKELEEKQNAPQQPSPEGSAPSTEGGQPSVRPTQRTPSSQFPSSVPGAAPSAVSPSFGRVDALTIGAASLSAAGLISGLVFGIKALAERPSEAPTTSAKYPWSALQSALDQAHRDAVFSDIGFGVALVAGAATAYLYFGRPRATPAVSTGSTTVSTAPLPGGGALLVKGSF
jgi:tetratricopeptide (TPR) repeat protein